GVRAMGIVSERGGSVAGEGNSVAGVRACSARRPKPNLILKPARSPSAKPAPKATKKSADGRHLPTGSKRKRALGKFLTDNAALTRQRSALGVLRACPP